MWVNSACKVNSQIVGFLTSCVDFYSPLFYVGASVILYLGYLLWQVLFAPLDRIRVLGDIGYIADKGAQAGRTG